MIPCAHCQSPTECAGDRECYLWRCENPHAPKPETAATLAHRAGLSHQPEAPAPAAALDDLIFAARCWS